MSQTVTLNIANISCHHCTNTIVRETAELPGVINVEGNVKEKTATFTLQSLAALDEIKKTLAEIGYPATN